MDKHSDTTRQKKDATAEDPGKQASKETRESIETGKKAIGINKKLSGKKKVTGKEEEKDAEEWRNEG